MKHIKTFDYLSNKNYDLNISRVAARAVIIKDDLILMVKLNQTSEFKFPGGGVEENENYEDALIRETKEEAGLQISKIKSCIGYIDQIYPDKYHNDTVFYMRSIYYLVEINPIYLGTDFSTSEAKLGFEPKWVSIEAAIDLNRQKMKSGSEYHWTERELFMLEYLKDNQIK